MYSITLFCLALYLYKLHHHFPYKSVPLYISMSLQESANTKTQTQKVFFGMILSYLTRLFIIYFRLPSSSKKWSEKMCRYKQNWFIWNISLPFSLLYLHWKTFDSLMLEFQGNIRSKTNERKTE